jgi:cytochrome c oxidase cbb3-type subunit 1
LAGESTGFDALELPTYGALFVFLGYLLIGVWAAVTFHQRRVRPLFVSQWYLFTALFWFPWIYSTAQLLLVIFPLRGVAQSVIAWWFSANLLGVWLGLAGLAALFYFIPKLTNLELHSHYLALFTFWMLLVFGGWGGIHNTAPVPAWMPALSTVSAVLLLVPILAVAINIHRTLEGNFGKLAAHPSLPFFMFGAAAFIFAGLMKVAEAVFDTQQQLHFTWFSSAQKELYVYGFFVMAIYGVVYRVLPQLTATELPWPKLVRAHFWLAAAGILLLVVPLAIGGIIQGQQLADPAVNFVNITKSSLMFLRVSTIGILLLALGNLLFLANLVRLVRLFYQAKMLEAYATVTADLYKAAEVKP